LSPSAPASIPSIPTTYAGVEFKSRLEAHWAMFFAALGTPWMYEPKTYRMSGQKWQYTPDFLLPELGVLLEVKPAVVTDDALSAKYMAYGPELVTRGECRIFVFVIGSPRPRVAHAAFWKYGERTFSFESVFGESLVALSCAFSSRGHGDDIASLGFKTLKQSVEI